MHGVKRVSQLRQFLQTEIQNADFYEITSVSHSHHCSSTFGHYGTRIKSGRAIRMHAFYFFVIVTSMNTSPKYR
jgi:hypothetical protein